MAGDAPEQPDYGGAGCAVPSDAQLLTTLKSVFGHSGFRTLQLYVVRAILRGQDVLVLMPTGGGKSLCYQLPALFLPGLTVVVSPLIALMKDQVDRLHGLGVPATYVNSSLHAVEVSRRQAAVARGRVKLLYVAPERLVLPRFLDLLTSVQPAFFVIDEAHCISEWGHDFRPDYRELRRLRSLFPSAGIGAFTATATRRVREDIVAQLGLERPAMFVGSCNRPNLYYEVRPKRRAYEQLTAYLRERRDASGIVYCQTRAVTDELAAKLRADGFDTLAYHAGLEADERRRRQDAFAGGRAPIVVATIAFGMGIDKADLRFVVHYDLPPSLERYYQESGRAGRDGRPSDCILFYGYGDTAILKHFAEQKGSATERQVALRQLRSMVKWATATTCRRRALLAHFDERLDGQPECCCDVCGGPPAEPEAAPPTSRDEAVDCTIPAQMLLSCVWRTGQRFGLSHVVDVLRGSRGQRVLHWQHDKLSTYGIGREHTREAWHCLARAMLGAGYLRQNPEHFNAVEIAERGRAVLSGREKVLLRVPEWATPHPRQPLAQPTNAETEPADLAQFEALRALRRRLADERGVPAFLVFDDATLRAMASARPATREQLRRIRGVGDHKLHEFGDAFLAVIRQDVRRSEP